jgi:methylmalonyl-CoA mutase cobalamin-binding subunit
MPQRDLLEMLAANRPHAVVVSIRMTAFLPAFKELATAIRAAMPEALLLAVGTARITPVLLPLCNGVASTFAETQALLEKGLPHA